MDFDRLCRNLTPMAVRCIPMDDRHGRDVLVVVAKLTFDVGRDGRARLAIPQAPIRLTDQANDAGPRSSLRHACDIEPEKPGTDVLLFGTAHPPRGELVSEHAVSLRVASDTMLIDKTLIVVGPRVYERTMAGIVPSPPRPLEPTPLKYELAYGGYDATSAAVDRRNPAGRGVAADRAALVGQPAAQIEYPSPRIDSGDPRVAGFGPIPMHWEPRSGFAGTFDSRWQRERAPIPPEDMNPRFYCSAPEDQWCALPLVGDEAVEIVGATAGADGAASGVGRWAFRLPRIEPRFSSVVQGEQREHPTHLDTMSIDADAPRVELVWRAAVPLPLRPHQLERVEVRAAMPAELVIDYRERRKGRARGEARP
jgi:hypothetical protein